jgi:hypothetical protein
MSFILSTLPDDTCIQYDNIGIFRRISRSISKALKGRSDALGIGDIHLAACCPNVIFHGVHYNLNKSELNAGVVLKPSWSHTSSVFVMWCMILAEMT